MNNEIEYLKHWADVIGTAYVGLSIKEKESLEALERDISSLYTGAKNRLNVHIAFRQEAYQKEHDNVEGYLDGIEAMNDRLEGIVSNDYFNTVDALIAIWSDLFMGLYNRLDLGGNNNGANHFEEVE